MEQLLENAKKQGEVRVAGCPACSAKYAYPVKGRIYLCARCDAIFGDCYLGESYEFVLPQFSATEPGVSRYYDFTCLGSKGLTRRHGWYDPATRLITQVG